MNTQMQFPTEDRTGDDERSRTVRFRVIQGSTRRARAVAPVGHRSHRTGLHSRIRCPAGHHEGHLRQRTGRSGSLAGPVCYVVCRDCDVVHVLRGLPGQ